MFHYAPAAARDTIVLDSFNRSKYSKSIDYSRVAFMFLPTPAIELHDDPLTETAPAVISRAPVANSALTPTSTQSDRAEL
jgi:hypothetical protein